MGLRLLGFARYVRYSGSYFGVQGVLFVPFYVDGETSWTNFLQTYGGDTGLYIFGSRVVVYRFFWCTRYSRVHDRIVVNTICGGFPIGRGTGDGRGQGRGRLGGSTGGPRLTSVCATCTDIGGPGGVGCHGYSWTTGQTKRGDYGTFGATIGQVDPFVYDVHIATRSSSSFGFSTKNTTDRGVS